MMVHSLWLKPKLFGLMFGCLIMMGWSPNIIAHQLAFGTLDVYEQGNGLYLMDYRYARSDHSPTAGTASLPEHCQTIDSRKHLLSRTLESYSRMVDCGPQGLVGFEMGMLGIEDTSAQVLLRIHSKDPDQPRVEGILTARHPVMRIGAGAADTQGFAYTYLGIKHILLGFDHVLFVLALFLFLKNTRELIKAITGFTIGHSITLVLSVLNLVNIPSQLAEVFIAMSLVIIAVEYHRAENKHNYFRQYPWLFSIFFGLFHGLGFSSVLLEIGLPDTGKMRALLQFNLGVEIGQLMILTMALVCVYGMDLLKPRLSGYYRWQPFILTHSMSLFIGSAGAFWFWERIFSL